MITPAGCTELLLLPSVLFDCVTVEQREDLFDWIGEFSLLTPALQFLEEQPSVSGLF